MMIRVGLLTANPCKKAVAKIRAPPSISGKPKAVCKTMMDKNVAVRGSKELSIPVVAGKM